MTTQYMEALMALNNAMEKFISIAYSENFDKRSIAGNILDSIYDADKDIFKEAQYAALPMVKEFNQSKSLKYEKLESDWKKAMVEWEQREMWKIMNG